MLKKQHLEQITRYADMFSAMGTESRLRIMQLLLSAHPDGLIVGEIGNELEIPGSTLSHHLEKLKNENLVKVRREGTFLWYSANTEVLQELLRVLKPGGRFAVSDVVVRGNVPAEIKKNMELWVGCVAGALSDYEYVAKLAKAGFDNIDIEATRVYNIDDARVFLSNRGLDVEEIAKELDGKFISAFVRATKPATACCASVLKQVLKINELKQRIQNSSLLTLYETCTVCM